MPARDAPPAAPAPGPTTLAEHVRRRLLASLPPLPPQPPPGATPPPLCAAVHPPTDDVRRDHRPPDVPPSRRLHARVRAMQGERTGMQLALLVPGSVPAPPGGFGITCHASNAAPTVQLSHVREALGGVRDALVPLDDATRVPLLPGVAESVWVHVRVPDDAPPGAHQVAVDVALARSSPQDANGVTLACLRARVRHATHVLENMAESTGESAALAREALAEQARITVDEGVRRLDGGARQVLVTLVVEVHVCGMRVWDHRMPFLVGVSEEVLVARSRARNAEGLREEIHRVLDFLLGLGCVDPYVFRNLADMEVHCYSSPYGMSDARTLELYSRAKAFCVPVQPPPGLDAEAFWSSARRFAATHPDLWNRHIAYAWDEPTALSHYARLRDRVALAESAMGSPLRVLATFYCGPKDVTHPTPDSFESLLIVPERLRGAVRVFSVSAWAFGERPRAAQALEQRMSEANGEESWGYVCMGPGDPHPNWHLKMRGLQQRAVAWRAWADGHRGFLYWGANCYRHPDPPGAPVCARDGLPPGDGVLVYPGDAFGVPKCAAISSVRLERALLGLTDAAWLSAYASAKGRDAAFGLLHRYLYRAPNAFADAPGSVAAFRDACWEGLVVPPGEL